MKPLILVSLIFLAACGAKDVYVYVHHESTLPHTFSYSLYVDDKKVASDSIKFNGVAPNFNEYIIKEKQGILRLTLDTLSKQIAINPDVRFYSFFLLGDTGSGRNNVRILVKEHKDRPTFY
jgi:hypothetical protein